MVCSTTLKNQFRALSDAQSGNKSYQHKKCLSAGKGKTTRVIENYTALRELPREKQYSSSKDNGGKLTKY